MRQKFMALAFATLLPLGAMTAVAQAEETQSPEAMVRDGLEKVMAAISLFVDKIPIYAAPEVLPNGDILIRRVQPDDDAPSDPSSPQDNPRDNPQDGPQDT